MIIMKGDNPIDKKDRCWKKGDLLYREKHSSIFRAKLDGTKMSFSWSEVWEKIGKGKLIKDTKIARKLNQNNIIAEKDGYLIIKE